MNTLPPIILDNRGSTAAGSESKISKATHETTRMLLPVASKPTN